jgi:hypothetical protein
LAAIFAEFEGAVSAKLTYAVANMWRSFLVSALTLLSACGPTGRPLTPNDIASSGTARFEAPLSKVFNATQDALKSEGYEIATADESKHLIKTNRKLIRAVAVGDQYSAQATTISRQYVVKLESEGKSTVVMAEPRVYQGDQDLSAEPVWDLDSPAGERALWSQLFKDIGEAL